MARKQLSTANGASLRGKRESHDYNDHYFYPPVPTPQQPLPAQINHAKHFSEGSTTDGSRVQSSMSTVSASSGSMNKKQPTRPPGSQWPSPIRERTLVDNKEQRPGHWQSSHLKASHSRQHSRRISETPERNPPALACIRKRQRHEGEGLEEEEEDHALWVLFWLSFLDLLHSSAGCLFTLLVTSGLILALPIRLCHKTSSFGDQVIRAVAPMFKNHLEMMYASSVDYAFEWEFRPGMLIFMHLISPLISVGVAVAAWITAAFWVFTSIMGNPDGTERRDDGADAVLAVRNWWEACLLTATRLQVKHPGRSVV